MAGTELTVAVMKKLLATSAPSIEIMIFCMLFETIVIFRLQFLAAGPSSGCVREFADAVPSGKSGGKARFLPKQRPEPENSPAK